MKTNALLIGNATAGVVYTYEGKQNGGYVISNYFNQTF